jgi:hypothetical protein
VLGRFSAEETTWAAAGLLRRWIEQYGVPQALYTDWKNVVSHWIYRLLERSRSALRICARKC